MTGRNIASFARHYNYHIILRLPVNPLTFSATENRSSVAEAANHRTNNIQQ